MLCSQPQNSRQVISNYSLTYSKKMSRYSTQPTMQRGASSNKVEDFEDMLDMDPYDLDENVKSLLVAEKLEEQYQRKFSKA